MARTSDCVHDKSWVAESSPARGGLVCRAGATTRPPEGKLPSPLDPLVPIRALVKTWMPLCILTGLLARGALGGAALGHQDLVNGGQIPLVLFNRTTDDAHGFFMCHGRDSFLSRYRGALSYRVLPTSIISQNREPGLRIDGEGSGPNTFPLFQEDGGRGKDRPMWPAGVVPRAGHALLLDGELLPLQSANLLSLLRERMRQRRFPLSSVSFRTSLGARCLRRHGLPLLRGRR
jgi:hypothetical protein